MRKFLLGLVASAALVVPLLGTVAPANATEDTTPYVLVAWQMPDDGSGWPQQLSAFTDTGVVSLDLLDATLAERYGCHQYQIDLYADTQALTDLLGFGVLGDVGSPPEPGVITWKYLTAGTGCETEPTVVAPSSYYTDPCGTANDTYGVNPVVGIEYEQHGGWIIARTLPGYVFPTVLPEGWGIFQDGVAIDLGNFLTNVACPVPSIGGRTIGFWTNKNGTAAGAPLWGPVAQSYVYVVQGLTFAQAQTLIKNATCATDCVSMLRAQFFATALNSYYIPGYKDQLVAIPADVATALGTGTCIPVYTLLSKVNINFSTITASKPLTTSVKTVLDRINQDVPLVASQCVA